LQLKKKPNSRKRHQKEQKTQPCTTIRFSFFPRFLSKSVHAGVNRLLVFEGLSASSGFARTSGQQFSADQWLDPAGDPSAKGGALASPGTGQCDANLGGLADAAVSV